MERSLESLVAGARAALGSVGHAVGHQQDPGTHTVPRYELFNGANSICSQKVRSVFAHHGLAYVSHTVKVFEGQTYLPGYVRLRMAGCERLGGALASHHSGSTSTASGGCDGAVVPTLVDWQAGEVIVDSRRICLYLDSQIEAGWLYPPGLHAAIDDELTTVDNLPNYQLLMGRKVAESEAAATRDDVGGSLSRRKVAWCDRFLQEHADDPTLVRAYAAKRAKELSAADELFTPAAMQAAYDRADASLQGLQRKLAGRSGSWLCADAVTMADLFWGVELLRMKNMGVATLWQGGRLPAVDAFSAATEALPSIRAAVVDWPGAMF